MLVKPFRLLKISKYLKKERAKFNILDVGAGSHSASITKQWFPNSEYHGLDITKSYNNSDIDFDLMDKFYEMDLTKLDFSKIQDDFYDIIIMSHVIEHLFNGDRVVECILEKLKKDGLIYIEYPSFRSTKMMSMNETLNFWDDPTHCRIYSLIEVYNLLMKNKMKILEGGTRRQWINIFLMPFKAGLQLLTKRYVRAGVVWDAAGFAEYVIAKK